MAIWQLLNETLAGGFKTHGPNAIIGPGAFDAPDSDPDSAVNVTSAMKLSAFRACVALRSEVIGTLPLHLRNGNREIVKSHPLYRLLHVSPNAWQTAPEYWSSTVAMCDIKGNAISVIERGYKNSPVALNPFDPDDCKFEFNKSGSRRTWTIGGDEYDDADVLHFKGFSLDGAWGHGSLALGRQILAAQLSANTSAMRAFKQGLKVGGFLIPERGLTPEQVGDIGKMLDKFSLPQNVGKWMTMLHNIKPVAGTEFAVKPSDAQLLESRHFGIEEICRLTNVPPVLIGHTSKTSSWASSLEHTNLHFLTYSVAPTVGRNEATISKKLLAPAEVASGLEAKWSLQGLMRGDMKSRREFYASGLKDGWLNQDEVRAWEEMGSIPGGDVYRVQAQMIPLTETEETSDEEAANNRPPV